ncbi:MAG TPA: YihY/virulence factor BrkB family protein [Geminicoccaceae bacterium]|nr:YihY/virulence factor BrkB family protein [Geminicoccaceae bacterium]
MNVKRPAARAFLLLRRGAASLVAAAGSRDAAQVAYYLVMSFPATLLLLVWCFSALLGDDSVRQAIVDSIVDALPLGNPEDQRQVERLLDDVAAGAGSLGWISLLALLYSASGAIGALRYAINEAWGERDTRPFVLGKALDAGLTLVVGPVLIVGLGLTLSGALAESIGDRPWLAAVAQFAVTKLVPIVLLLAVLVGLFRLLPVERAGFRAAWLGGLAALAGIVLVQTGVEAYFSAFGDTSAVYGTLGVLLAVVFSAFLDALAIVYGAHVAAQAALLPSAAAIDNELEKRAGTPPGRFVVNAVRGLFVRARERR